MYLVYSCGSNGNGQLGLEHENDVATPEIAFQSSLPLKSISCGGNHTALLMENGDVYQTGLVNGRKTHKFELTHKDISGVVAGWDCTLKITRTGAVYNNDDTKIWQGPSDVKFTIANLDSFIVGYDSGQAVCSGNNKKGQLLGDDVGGKTVEGFQELTFNELPFSNVTLVKCCLGRDFSLFVLSDGTSQYLAMRGKSDRYGLLEKLQTMVGSGALRGELGVNKTRWFKIAPDVTVVALKSMWSSVHLQYTRGNETRFCSVGNNVYRQLLQRAEHVWDFQVGTEHGVTVSENRKEAHAWGWGEHGNCGVQGIDNCGELTLLYTCAADETIQQVYAGYASTWIVVYKEDQ